MEITIRFTSPRGGRRLAAALIAVVLLAVPSAAFGSHLFGDVPDANPFHDQISDIETAGITAGCGGGNFCPTGTLTREQEAAFLSRGLSRAVASNLTLDTAIGAADGWVTIAGVDVEVPGVGGTQRIVARGEVTAVTDPSGLNDCGAGQRCYINVRLRDATSGQTTSPSYYAFTPNLYHQELVGRQGLFVGASGIRRYELQVDLINASDLIQFTSASIIVTTHPLNASPPTEELTGPQEEDLSGQVNGGS